MSDDLLLELVQEQLSTLLGLIEKHAAALERHTELFTMSRRMHERQSEINDSMLKVTDQLDARLVVLERIVNKELLQ